MTELDGVLKGYIDCAFWVELDDNGKPLDSIEGLILSKQAYEAMEADVKDFLTLLDNESINWQEHMDYAQLGHDFWLTRNRHGTGFWDRGLGQLGETLTSWAHSYGEQYLYIGDDNHVYSS